MLSTDAASVANRRYLTFTFAHEGGRPGFMHIQRCLATLIDVARLAGRTALLPPPALLLHPDHNYAPGYAASELDASVQWTRYFNFSALLASGTVALSPTPTGRFWSPPTADSKAWKLNRRLARVADSERVPPHTPWWELGRMPHTTVTLTFRDGWGVDGQRYVTDCAHPSVGRRDAGAASGHTPPKSFVPISETGEDLTPSAMAVGAAARLAAPLAKPFAMVHVRRGDALEGSSGESRDAEAARNYSHGGCGVTNVRRATSPQHIAATYRRFYPALARSGAPLLVMTNELEPRYFRRLRAVLPNAILARELEDMRRMQDEYHDNYYAFVVLGQLARHAAGRIGTTGCHLAGGCEHYLNNERCSDNEAESYAGAVDLLHAAGKTLGGRIGGRR